ncbi:MAG TPA: PIN domain-containing protein [Albitalea sp.]|nr:PIN domain-containing protein [Albitalea sp.]
MQRVIVDAGPLIGWFDANDAHHPSVRAFLDAYGGELLSTWPVLVEVCHLLPERMVADFLRWVGRGGVTVVDVPVSALAGLADRIDKYADLPIDMADASIIWLAETLGLLEVLTIDRRDSGIYRTARGQALRNMLFDAPPAAPVRRRAVRRKR